MHGILLHKSDHGESWQWMMIGGITPSPHIIYLTQVLSLESMMRGAWRPSWVGGFQGGHGEVAYLWGAVQKHPPISSFAQLADEGASVEDADGHEVWGGV